MMGQNLKFFGWNGELNTPYVCSLDMFMPWYVVYLVCMHP
jgi:hypothetical protein